MAHIEITYDYDDRPKTIVLYFGSKKRSLSLKYFPLVLKKIRNKPNWYLDIDETLDRYAVCIFAL